jgi:hypothetical protein
VEFQMAAPIQILPEVAMVLRSDEVAVARESSCTGAVIFSKKPTTVKFSSPHFVLSFPCQE